MADQIIVSANGAAIPAIGLGTWRLAGEHCAEIVAHALSIGYRHVDTAARYENEVEVGRGLAAAGLPRDAVFVTTKIPESLIADGDLQRSAEASLKRLGLSHVDLLLIHWPNAAIPLAGSLKALAETKRRGLARHIGVSNFPSALVEEAVRLCPEPLVTNQCEYHPYLAQTKVLEACRRHGLSFTSYCPIGRASLLDDPAIRRIAARHGRTPAQILLRWHVQQPGVIAIPKSGDRGRVAENLAVFDFALDDAEMAALHALAKPNGRMISPATAPAWDA